MKTAFLFLTTLLLVSTNAIEIPDELKQWKCDSSEVRLSKNPIPCLGEFPEDFEIPAVELNLEDLQKIFDGAVSSGGHVVGPMNSPRRVRPLSPNPFTLNCHVKVLLDGGKRVSYLSKGNIALNNQSYFIPFAGVEFKHGLIVGNDIDSSWVAPSPKAPRVSLDDLYAEVAYSKTTQKYALKVCAQDFSLKTTKRNCSLSSFEREDGNVNASFMSTISQRGYHVERTVQLNCFLR